MVYRYLIIIFFFAGILNEGSECLAQPDGAAGMVPVYPMAQRMLDSIQATNLPLLPFPDEYRNRLLPYKVDNSANDYWPGIRDQYVFYSCQQHAGVGYTFSYEINRLRNKPGWMWENSYSPHYTWNFMNLGERYQGVNFLQSFDLIKRQGQMTSSMYGEDTAQMWLGWVSGYEKYYQGMFNRIKNVYAIEVNSEAGINQLRNYLYDHLDGSSTGGIACFTTSSGTFVTMTTLPPGTEEEGKNVVVAWMAPPIHGLTVVGYNDSIRYDINQDGKYTNDIDITGDGITDARDWEIGAFKIANSYGTWWSDQGFVYALYSSFALPYPYGGVWNNRVYVVDADSGYRPLLTAKINLTYNRRNQIRVYAGVSQDTTLQAPQHILEIPIFNYQGGPHSMQGFDTLSNSVTIEFGLDLTSLLNEVSNNAPARYFILVDEKDPEYIGQGSLNAVSLRYYGTPFSETVLLPASAAIRDNTTTIISAVANLQKPDVTITTTELPVVEDQTPYQAQMQATGGQEPYSWHLKERYLRKETPIPMPVIPGASGYTFNNYTFFETVPLPFQFPFYGKMVDTMYVNHYGFITFQPYCLPEPYLTDEMGMLAMFPVIAPAFSQYTSYNFSMGDGIWIRTSPEKAEIRWRVSVSPWYATSTNEFAVILYPDGNVVFRYGIMDNRNFTHRVWSGISKGDGLNNELEVIWDANALNSKGYLFYPQPVPPGLDLSPTGLLSLNEPNSGTNYNLQVTCMDAGRITDTKNLVLGGSLMATLTTGQGDGSRLSPGKSAPLKLKLHNRGNTPFPAMTITIACSDTLVSLSDSIEAGISLSPGQELSFPDAFTLSLADGIPNGYPIFIDLQGVDGIVIFKQRILLQAEAPVILLGKSMIQDGDNNRLDPGEVADLVIPVSNQGWITAQEVTISLESPDTTIRILSPAVFQLGDLQPVGAIDAIYRLKASRFCRQGSHYKLIATLSDSSGVLKRQELDLICGRKPVVVVDMAPVWGSARAMYQALDSLGVEYDSVKTIPFDYENCEVAFLVLGCSSQGSHTLTINEATSLTGFLGKRGKLYMESYTSWYYLNNTPLHPWFKYTSQKVAPWVFTEVEGVTGTLGDSLRFSFTGPINYAIFDLQPVAPAKTTITNTDSIPMNVQIAYDGDDYKTIATILEFGSLHGSNTVSDKVTLMRRYLDFFGVNLDGPTALFHADKNRVCTGGQVTFTDDSFNNIITRTWEFPGGEPSYSSQDQPLIKYSEPGIYDVRLTVSDGVHEKSLQRKAYIRVESCQAVLDPPSVPLLMVYPNPVKARIYLKITDGQPTMGTLRIFNSLGCVVWSTEIAEPRSGGIFSADISHLPEGLYVLTLNTSRQVFTAKLIKN
jgi:PKD repeat protein